MISVVVPIFNEAPSLNQLNNELVKAFKKLDLKYEIIFVNDGSTDKTSENLENLYKKDKERVKVIEFLRNFGKADALKAGFKQAKGEIIVTIDSDLQDDPAELPKLIKKLDQGYDLVSGWKMNRQDRLIKRASSRVFNLVNKFVFKLNLNDFNCGFKAYKARVAKQLDLYGELHRFIPVMVATAGYQVAEVPVKHRPRKHGQSKYGPIRFLHGFFDFLTVLFITRFRLRPLHLFGNIGLSLFSLGFLGGVYLVYIKIFLNQLIGQRPLLLLSALLMIIGVQIGVTGLLAELVATVLNKNKPSYTIKKKMIGK